jgi:N6-adenosine-specific RNA methylase IME4
MKQYNIIYADPPWYFKTYSDLGRGRSADNHYKCMQLEDIKNLPVGSIAAEDSVLFLWVPIPHLEYGLEVIKVWGFKYKTFGFVWVKGRIFVKEMTPRIKWHIGLGYWTRANTEICLLATRGHPHRKSMSVRQVVFQPVGEHSAKPLEVRNRIVELMGDLPRVELFAREKVEGWDSWGDEIASDNVFGELNAN